MHATRAALALAAASVIAALPLLGSEESRRITSCDSYQMRFDGDETLRAEQVLDVAGSELAIEAPENGGVRVQGGTGGGFHVLVCKAVADGGRATLDAITARVEGGKLVVHGPDAERWGVHLVVDVPRDARVSVAAENGPVSVLEVTGSVRVDTVNGPVSAVRTDGALQVSAENGPVSIVDASGDVKVKAENGPLSVKLASGSWRGEGLEARTQNGPISLRVPDGYGSGVEVTMSRRAPLTCPDGICAGSQQVEGSRRTVALGEARTSVRLETSNGPVAIRTRA
jgi:hypothetical protein